MIRFGRVEKIKFFKDTMCGNDTVQGKQVMECALAASLCTMVLGLTSEHTLLQYPGLGPAELHTIFTLILMNLERCQRVSDWNLCSAILYEISQELFIHGQFSVHWSESYSSFTNLSISSFLIHFFQVISGWSGRVLTDICLFLF